MEEFYDGAGRFGLRSLFRMGGKNCWEWFCLRVWESGYGGGIVTYFVST